ncbi:MAG: P-loop NTPase [Spirochaetales bacterium]|nr:P-loop NTPase [Spirochaetales bacterium]
MNDQAESLRKLVSSGNNRTVIIAVTAAKKGYGTTSTSVNIAVSLILQKKRVVLLDSGNTTLQLFGGNHSVLDTPASYSTPVSCKELLKGKHQLQDVLIQTPEGLRILTHTEAVTKAGDLGKLAVQHVRQELGKLEEADFVIVHVSPGIAKETIPFITGADILLLISEPDIHAVRDTYGMIKTIIKRIRKDRVPDMHLIINKSISDESSKTLAKRLGSGVQQFLNYSITYAGAIPLDKIVSTSGKSGKPFVIQSPVSSASLSVGKVTTHIVNKTNLNKPDNSPMYSGIIKFIDCIT